MKYKIIKDRFKIVNGKKLYRIQALMDFGSVKEGSVGGYIEGYDNLSQEGICWIYDDACVYDSACVYGNARVFDDTRIYDSARVYNNACVYGNTYVCGNSRVYGNAHVYRNAHICGDARVFGDAHVYGNANIYGNARVYGHARVRGHVSVYGDARVYASAHLCYGKISKDIKEDLINYIACSLNVYPVNGKYILYKKVNKVKNGVYSSLYDKSFIYRDGEIVQIEYYNPDFNVSCDYGLHVSTPFYWEEGNTLIAVEVNVDDIITCMKGKIRCKKLKVIGEIKNG